MAHLILLAAGHGKRSGASNKLIETVCGKAVWEHALEPFKSHQAIDSIVLVVNEKSAALFKTDESIHVTMGGDTRQDSARLGFEKLKSITSLKDQDIVVVHNAANPSVTQQEIDAVIEEAERHGAAAVGHPSIHTLKKVDDGKMVETLPRETVWEMQTPQAMQAKHYQIAIEKKATGTDEMQLMEQIGLSPKLVQASENNFKITTPRDLNFLRFLLGEGRQHTGMGMDSHQFDRAHQGLMLGGVYLEDEPKMLANSDGDVMLHALCTAILQAIGEGSLGTVTDPLFEQGITESARYLEHILEKMERKGFKLNHVGFQIEGKYPKIDPIAHQIKVSLSKQLGLKPTEIGITATTGEGLTPFGRGEGLQCFATVTLNAA